MTGTVPFGIRGTRAEEPGLSSGISAKHPVQLSGGEQQRVAIARSLALDPGIMLFDEPTSALGPEMVKEVLDVMTEPADSNMTLIVTTHELGFAKAAADHIAFFDQGRIVETGRGSRFRPHPWSIPRQVLDVSDLSGRSYRGPLVPGMQFYAERKTAR